MGMETEPGSPERELRYGRWLRAWTDRAMGERAGAMVFALTDKAGT